MIDSLAVLSRAYRSTLDEEPMALTEVLVDSEQRVQGDPDIDQVRVAVDGRVVQKLLRVLRDAQPDEIVVEVTADALRIESPAPESEYGIGDSPLETLFSSLTAHAGTQVQSLAEAQVQLGRQGSTISFEDGRTVVLVPLAAAS